MLIEERLNRIEEKLDQVLNVLFPKTHLDYSGKRFLGLENVFMSNDNINPMICQGCIYEVDSNNTAHFHYGKQYISMDINELLNTYGNKIFWLTNK